MTVDTLNNDVSGQLLDSVTLFADSGASAPEQSVPQPQYVVDGIGDAPDTFDTLSGAVSQAESGAVVGIEGGVTESPDDFVTIDTTNLTITGFDDSTSVIDDANDGGIEISADGVTLRDLEITGVDDKTQPSQVVKVIGAPDSLTIDGVTARAERNIGGPVLSLDKFGSTTGVGDNLLVTNCEIINNSIGISLTSTSNSAEITDNTINPGGDGIFVTDTSGTDLLIENNGIVDIGDDDAGSLINSGNFGIKLTESAASVNGATGIEGQLQSLLTENTVSEVNINGEIGTSSDGPNFDNLQGAVNAATRLTLVEPGTYNESITVNQPGLTVSGLRDPVIDASDEERGFGVKADGVTIRGLTIANAGEGVTSGEVEGIFVGNRNGFTNMDDEITIDDVVITNVDGTSSSTEGIHVKHYNEGDPIDGVNINNVSIDGVNSGGAGGNGIKLQADVNNVDISNTTIETVTGRWGYGVVLTPSGNETGVPGDVGLDQLTIDGVDPREFDGVGVGIDSASGQLEPESNGGKVADPGALTFTDVVIKNVDIGILDKNTDVGFSEPNGVTFSAIADKNVSDQDST
jgi:parallel beta-helix repeat protein